MTPVGARRLDSSKCVLGECLQQSSLDGARQMEVAVPCDKAREWLAESGCDGGTGFLRRADADGEFA